MLYVMLVGAYPFERPEDKHDNQKLQKMIQARIRTDIIPVSQPLQAAVVDEAQGCEALMVSSSRCELEQGCATLQMLCMERGRIRL